ncbi:MAG: LemA family protein [Nitrospira sp.]|nr:LemA family protein [Nitrospira sp.]
MSAGRILLMVFGGLLVLILMLGGCVYSGYNQVIEMDEAVKSQWAQVENQLQRRFELIPNLVNTVKGVASQEEKIYLGVANARKAYFQAQSVNEKARAAGGFELALSRLLVLRETYPQLKSDQSFLKLQDQLEGTENRLAVERKRYNDGVRVLNTFIRKLLGRLYAGLAGVEQAEYFEIGEEARATPKVEF